MLNQTVERLDGLPHDEVMKLDLSVRQARTRAKSAANIAVEKLENAKLKVLNAAFESKRHDLESATRDLGKDLAKLTDTVAFIGAAASAVGIISDIVSVIP